MRTLPKDVPLEQWTPAWLKMECASLLDIPMFIMLTDAEKRKVGYPVTKDEMRAFIRARREADAMLANPDLIPDAN